MITLQPGPMPWGSATLRPVNPSLPSGLLILNQGKKMKYPSCFKSSISCSARGPDRGRPSVGLTSCSYMAYIDRKIIYSLQFLATSTPRVTQAIGLSNAKRHLHVSQLPILNECVVNLRQEQGVITKYKDSVVTGSAYTKILRLQG